MMRFGSEIAYVIAILGADLLAHVPGEGGSVAAAIAAVALLQPKKVSLAQKVKQRHSITPQSGSIISLS